VSPNQKTFRFGVFEADARTGELRRGGLRVKLQGKPFQFLLVLLERPGELVTREELSRRLWSADTYVEFDRSLNIAARKLRTALNDTADFPRYVETLRGRGYRFIGQLEITKSNPPAAMLAAEMNPQTEGELPATSTHRPPSVPFVLTAGALALEKDRFARYRSAAETAPELQQLKGPIDSGGARPRPGVMVAASHPDAARAEAGVQNVRPFCDSR
jgi:DNA-binding winged helix-turn-helix (wHTH) protein